MSKVRRLYAIHCTECGNNIMFSYSEMPQPDHCLCYTCCSAYTRANDMLVNDGVERAHIEMNRLKTPVVATQMHGKFVSGLQLAITLRMKS